MTSAEIAPSDPDGSDWDDDADPQERLPDAHVAGSLGNDSFLDWWTTMLENSVSPYWGEAKGTYLQTDLVSQGFWLEIRDADFSIMFDPIAACLVDLAEADLLASSVSVECGANVIEIAFAVAEQHCPDSFD
ncbi:MAG: hypothetical protein GY811_08440 [Myxococcales bacterium]|nr:hypothetical protein [Myxococcales bacterium]